MNVVDSSWWIEYFLKSPQASSFVPAIHDHRNLVVSTISIYEVFKFLQLRLRDDSIVLSVVAGMQVGRVQPVTDDLAMEAARLSIAHRLPLADSIILATARQYNATLWTQDAHFDGLPDVKYYPR